MEETSGTFAEMINAAVTNILVREGLVKIQDRASLYGEGGLLYSTEPRGSGLGSYVLWEHFWIRS
jgi:hypothetical protein